MTANGEVATAVTSSVNIAIELEQQKDRIHVVYTSALCSKHVANAFLMDQDKGIDVLNR